LELVLATRNKKKIEEIARITAGMPVSILTLDDFPGCPEVEEDGSTFEENAVKKARAVAKCTAKPSLADDSGLEVYALHGAPGILSARYSGEGATDGRNIEKLLIKMRLFRKEERKARFVCYIALALNEINVVTFHGHVEGMIGTESKGFEGFGYDPVFYPEGYGRTFAEMRPEEKDSISHRGKALREFRRFLRERLSL
jgi:XTP/dITP diphosphohydrolase